MPTSRARNEPCGDSRPRLSSRAQLGLVLAVTLLTAAAQAQNPVPQIVGPVKPMAVAPGSGAFTLTVYGANFVSGAVVNWSGQPRSTTFVSAHEVQAQILATDVATNTAGLISVTNPAPGGGSSSSSWAQVEVHKPISTITVTNPVPYPIGVWSLTAADFNHDQTLDLVGEYGADLDFYAGKGDGSFHFGSIAGRAYQGTLPTVYGDFNNDGNLDVVLVQGVFHNQPTQMAIMLGDGKGKFTIGSRLKDYRGFGFTAVGDFNRDGKLDLVTSGYKQFAVRLGNGDGTFQLFKGYPYNQLPTTQIITGDFNDDDKLDLVLMQEPLPNNNNMGAAFYLLLGNGDGTFQAPQQIASFSSAVPCIGGGAFGNKTLQSGDFNGDGKLDLAFCDQSQIGILLGNGDGTFQPAAFYNAGTDQQFTFAIGDINSDGKQDLLVSNYYNFNNPEIDLHLGNGDGTFQPAQSIFGFPFGELGIVPGDFNSDGLLDFVFPTGLGSLAFIQK